MPVIDPVEYLMGGTHEYQDIGGAAQVPLHEPPARIGDLPGGQLWVHCQAGYRAAVAASLIDVAGPGAPGGHPETDVPDHRPPARDDHP